MKDQAQRASLEIRDMRSMVISSFVPLQEAFKNGPRETLLYLPAIVVDGSRPDYLATVDADPKSSTYSQVSQT